MELTIPIKALSNNQAWAGRRFKSAMYKQYEKDVDKLLPRAKKTLTGEVEIHYTFYIKNYGMTDVDNLIKETQDILVKKGYITDDRKIVFLSAEKIKSNDEKIEIQIRQHEK